MFSLCITTADYLVLRDQDLSVWSRKVHFFSLCTFSSESWFFSSFFFFNFFYPFFGVKYFDPYILIISENKVKPFPFYYDDAIKLR